MASARKLPQDDVLISHVQSGMTNRDIGNMYGTSGEAVRQALARAGYEREEHLRRPSHAQFIPWKLRGDHIGDVLARRLRSYSKHKQGKALSEQEERLLDGWIKFMDGANSYGIPLSVHYSRADEEGFWLEPRQPGDRDYISPPLETV